MITWNKGDKNAKIVGLILGGLIVFVFGFFLGATNVANKLGAQADLFSILSIKNPISNLVPIQSITDDKLYKEVHKLIKEKYVDSNVDEKTLTNGSIKGMVESLDDIGTVFFTKEETADYEKSLSGSFEGVGIELGYSQGAIIVKNILKGSPSERSGVKKGSIIYSVDDYKLVQDEDISKIVAKIRGKKGTIVKIGVIENTKSLKEDVKYYSIARDTLTSKSIDFSVNDKGVATIRMTRFTEDTIENFIKAWDDTVKDVLASKPKGIVVDLRGNPGGYLNGAYYIASDFLEKGKAVLFVKDRNGISGSYYVEKDPKLLNIPTIVLIDGNSASAAEIFSGALQKNNRAKIVGLKSFGKGTAQEVIKPDTWGGASLHLTVQKWLLPDKSEITKDSPIIPDVEVDITIDDIKQGLDPQKDKAIELILGNK